MTLLSDVGGHDLSDPSVDIGLRAGAATLPAQGTGCPIGGAGDLASGFFSPADNDNPTLDCSTDCVADPALDANNTNLGTFNETEPNGTWKLYVTDDCTGDLGAIHGWTLDLTTGPPLPPAATPPTTQGSPKKCHKKKHHRSATSAKKKCKRKRR